MDHNDIPIEQCIGWREVLAIGVCAAVGIAAGWGLAAACAFHTC